MKALRAMLLLAVLLGGAGLPSQAPRLLNWITEPGGPGHDPAAREKIHRRAREAVERLEKQYGHLPPEEWPEGAREYYEMARRALDY